MHYRLDNGLSMGHLSRYSEYDAKAESLHDVVLFGLSWLLMFGNLTGQQKTVNFCSVTENIFQKSDAFI
jgi:hypothetical protein